MDEKLNGIVQRMIDASESEANIALVIQHYKPEPVKKKDSPQVAPKPSAESPTVQPSSVSSDFKIKDERAEAVPVQDNLIPQKDRRVTTDVAELKKQDTAFKGLVRPEIERYRKETAVTDQDIADAKAELSAAKKEEGFLNTIKSYGSQLGNYITKGNFSKDNPLQDQMNQAKAEFVQSGIKTPTPEQISQRAEEIFLEGKLKSKKQQRINDFISSLDNPHMQSYLEGMSKYNVSKEIQDISKRIKLNTDAIHGIENDLENKDILPQDRAALKSHRDELVKMVDEDENAYQNDKSPLGSYKDELDVFRRNYDAIDNVKSRVVSSIGTAAIDLYSGTNYIANTLGAGEEDRQGGIQVAREGINEYKKGFRPDNEEITTGNALQYFTDLMANQAGTIVQMVAAGETGGATLLGTEAAGQLYSEMSQEQKKGKKFAPWQMMLAPAVSGISTGVLSALPTGQTLRNTARVWKAALKDPEGKVLYDQAIKGMTKSLLKETGADFKREVLTEELDNLNQNIIKRDILGDKSVGYFDNAYKVLTDTELMTAGLFSPRIPHIFMDGVKKFTAPADKAILDANGRAIASLAQQLDNPDLSDEVKASIKSEIKTKTKESGKIVKQTLKRLDGLEESEIKTVVLDGKKIEDIETQAQTIKDSDMPIDAEKSVLNGLQKEHSSLKEKTEAKLNEEIKKKPVAKEPETQPQAKEQTKITEIDEGKTTGTVTSDGDLRSGAVGDNTQGTENSKDAAAESREGENTIVPKKIKLEGKGGTYTVSKTEGRIQVLDKDGNEPSSKTRTKVESKYAETVDFSSGKTAVDVTSDGSTDAVLNYSENPSEVAQAVTTFALDDPQAQADYIRETIAENIGKIREKGFNRFDDRNNGSSQIDKAYFSPDGRHIDDLAKELSEIAGIPVTEADIAQFMKDHPKGAKEFFNKAKESGNESKKTLNALKDKFTALTGLPATVKNLHLAQEHFFQKEYNKEYGGSVNNMTDAQLEQLHNEILESEKNEKTTSKPKDNDEKPNRGGDEKESRVPRKGDEGNAANRKTERKRIAEASIDEVAQWLKSVLPKAEIDPADYKTQGVSQDALIDLMATAVKNLVLAGIEIDEAIKQVSESLRQRFDFKVDENKIRLKLADATIKVYHGGEVKSIGDMHENSPMYVSMDKKQAGEYAKGNEGKVRKFILDKSKIADEDTAREVISELGLEPENGEDSSEHLNIYELIDPRFETSFSDADIDKFFKAMQAKGYDGLEFTDSNLITLKNDIDNIVVFDPKKTLGIIEKTTKSDKKKIANAKIDEVADWLKSVLPKADIDLAEYKSQGFTQDQIIDIVAKIAKHLVSTGIEIEDAVRQATKMFKDQWSTEFDIDPAKVKERISPKAKNKESIDELVRSIPKKDEVKQYLSGETIEKYEGESPLNNQDYKVQGLQLALEHGVSIIESFKKEYGDQYVEGALDYLDKEKLSPESAALIYVSLENDLAARKLADPDNVGISKLQDLVREKSQAFLRSNAIAINFGRLRKFAEAGYDLSNVTDMFFSTSELEGKRKIEKAVQSNADDINAEAERGETEGVEEVTPPAKKRTKADVKAEMGAVLKQMRKDLLNAAKGDAAMSSIPYAAQLQVATPHILKLSKLLAELGVVKTKEIVEEILQSINGIAPDISKEDIRDIINENSDKAKANTANRLVKQALIDKGFSREITVSKRKVNENGTVTREKSKKEILDWKKLAGEEGSIDKIRKNVEQALADMGYTQKQIEGMYKELENEYHDLRALIIERSMNELDNRNTPRKSVDVKSSARRLAELYNYGLFEKEEKEYEHLINNAVGLNKLGQQAFSQAKTLAGKLSDLYQSKHKGGPVDEIGLSVAISKINNDLENLLSKVAWNQSNGKFKAASIVKDFAGMSQRALLTSLGQAIENPLSGYIERGIQKLGHAIQGGVDTKELRQKRRELVSTMAKDIVLNGGQVFGQVNTPLLAKTKTEDFLNGLSDRKLYHSAISFLMGKAFLEGADSAHKIALTEKYFAYNLVKVLTHKSNPNRMERNAAIEFVSEQLTGQNFKDAKITADEMVKTINQGEEKPILPENEAFKTRLANEIVKMSLLAGEKLTLDQIKDSYKAAYTAAGFGLGHEANNAISRMVSNYSARIEGELQQAVKEKKWNEATILTMRSIFAKNILNPFVSGGTNWVVLQLQKTGLDPFSLIANRNIAKDNAIDLSTEQGVKNLRNALVKQLVAKNTNNRVIIGGMAALATYALFASGGDDDDKKAVKSIDSWLKENEWAKKYFNKLSPQIIQLLIAMENEEVGSWLANLMGSKYPDRFMANFSGGVNDIAKGDFSKGKGKLGKAFGSKISAPLPYKLIMDTKNIYLGLTGQELYKPNYETAYGFLNGFFQGGLIEYMGLRPDSVNEEENSGGGLPKKPKMPSKPKKPTR